MILVSLPSQQRQGSFLTGTHVVTGDAAGTLCVHPVIEAADFADPTKSIFMRIYRFDVPSQTWIVVVAARWFGTPGANHSDRDEHPVLAANIESLRGQQIRGEVDIPSRMRVGCTVELV